MKVSPEVEKGVMKVFSKKEKKVTNVLPEVAKRVSPKKEKQVLRVLPKIAKVSPKVANMVSP